MKKNRRIDPIKAFLAIFFSAIISIVMIVQFFIPDIKKLKIVHMNRDKTEITLEQARIENETKKKNLLKITSENKRAINILENKFLSNKFHSEISKYFSQIDLDIKGKNINDQFETKEFGIKAELKDPNNFYEFIDSLKNSSYAVGVDFPIAIKADENFNLELDFIIKAYSIKE